MNNARLRIKSGGDANTHPSEEKVFPYRKAKRGFVAWDSFAVCSSSRLKHLGRWECTAAIETGGSCVLVDSSALGARHGLRAHASIGLAVAQVHLLHFPQDHLIAHPRVGPHHFPQRLAGERQGIDATSQVFQILRDPWVNTRDGF